MKLLFWLALLLLAIAMVFYALENVFFALLFFVVAIFIVIGTILYRALKFSGRKAKKATSKIIEEMEKAEPQHPSQELIGSGLNELGKKVGEHYWEEKKVWTLNSKGSGLRERIGKSSKKFVEKFFELFK